MSGENYPANYWAYLDTLPKGGTLPKPTYLCGRCGTTFASGKARNEHVREGKCR